MPKRLVKLVEPVVRHGMKELAEGVPVEHTLREVALMGALVGTGVPPEQAIAMVEEKEEELLGVPGGERGERMWAPGGWRHPMHRPMPWGCGMGGGWMRHGWDPGMGKGGSPWDWASTPMPWMYTY